MTLFEEPFEDQTRLTRDWVTCPGMAVRSASGSMVLKPANIGHCV
jgi:hypothetical protein